MGWSGSGNSRSKINAVHPSSKRSSWEALSVFSKSHAACQASAKTSRSSTVLAMAQRPGIHLAPTSLSTTSTAMAPPSLSSSCMWDGDEAHPPPDKLLFPYMASFYVWCIALRVMQVDPESWLPGSTLDGHLLLKLDLCVRSFSIGIYFGWGSTSNESNFSERSVVMSPGCFHISLLCIYSASKWLRWHADSLFRPVRGCWKNTHTHTPKHKTNVDAKTESSQRLLTLVTHTGKGGNSINNGESRRGAPKRQTIPQKDKLSTKKTIISGGEYLGEPFWHQMVAMSPVCFHISLLCIYSATQCAPWHADSLFRPVRGCWKNTHTHKHKTNIDAKTEYLINLAD